MFNPFLMFNTYFANFNLKYTNPLDNCEFLLIQKFLNIFCNRFEYDGLPKETKVGSAQNNILELMMFFSPAVVWFRDDVLGVQCLPVAGDFDYKITGLPTRWRVQGANGYNKEFDETNSSIMFNDSSYSIPFLHTLYEIKFMTECDKTHSQEIFAHRRPIIMEMEEDEKKSGNLFIQKLKDFSNIIKIRLRQKDKGNQRTPYNTQMFQATEKDFNGKVYMDDFKEFENRILTYYGINNVNIEKRERLLTGEISANDMIIQTNYTSALNARKYAIEKANEMFGTNISIKPSKLMAMQALNLNTQQIQNQPQGVQNGISNQPNVQS